MFFCKDSVYTLVVQVTVALTVLVTAVGGGQSCRMGAGGAGFQGGANVIVLVCSCFLSDHFAQADTISLSPLLML